MDAEKINLFISTKGDYFPKEAIPMIRERLEHLDPAYELSVMSANYISPTLNIILSIFVGCCGVDRFLIGDIGIGIGKFLTFWIGIWFCFIGVIWPFIDLFLIMGATKKKNLERFLMAVGCQG